MSNGRILTTEELAAITGYTRAADIERCLRENNIRTFQGRSGPWTTIDLVNRAGGIMGHGEESQVEPLQF